jgi:hypothetical protein
MPTRLLRGSINRSQRVNKLDFAAEVFYRRLMSVVDDHGLFEACPVLLRADTFPLRCDRVREADITRWLAECQTAGLIVLYEADGKKYGKMLDTNWKVRSEPRYPVPPANICKQLPADANLVVDVVVDEGVVVADAHTPTLAEFQKHAEGLCIPPPVVEACYHYYAAAGFCRGQTRLTNFRSLLMAWWAKEQSNPKKPQPQRPRMAI